MGDLVRTDDADIDALLGDTFARVGPSPTVAEASRRLQEMLDTARGERPALIDPRTLALRFTRMKAMSLSAAHYLLAAQDGRDETIAMRMGSAFHASVFGDREVLCYDGRRQGKAWERFERAAHEKYSEPVILNRKEYLDAMGLIDAVRRHPRAMELLFEGSPSTELKIDWAIGARACQSTPDSFLLGHKLVELKSTRCGRPEWFAREAMKRHYHAQLAFYEDAMQHFGRAGEIGRPVEVHIVAVENIAPWNVTIMRLPDETREAGARLARLWFEQATLAEDTGTYGGYIDHDYDWHLPTDDGPVDLEIDGELVTVD